MDELELLKQDWKKREKDLPHFEASELYPMLLKKSSSIVKWIFIISIIELSLSVFLNFFIMDEEHWNRMESIHLKSFTIVMYVVNYIIVGVFIYYFYKNYKTISTTDSASQLMRNILKTRKVVKYYIWYVLISSGVVSMFVFVFMLLYPPVGSPLNQVKLDWESWAIYLLIGLVATILMLGIIWGIYSLLYGILLRKLKRNYKELRKLKF